ncbi:MAG TPA: PKD domain-containing protein [Solirubrobacteraceae bacterium]|nr:PKD domain-containing protein [Solirubrobacteraceae bacterium]
MRPTNPMRGRWMVACAAVLSGVATALLAGFVAAPASGVTNLYAPQHSGTNGQLLSEFAVAADGSLSALAPADLGIDAQDIAITPDGRFAYVTRNPGTDVGAIAEFARGAGGRMDPLGSVTTGADPEGIVVDPQGARIYDVSAQRHVLESRPIAADGTLGAVTSVDLGATAAPRFVAMTPDGTSLYVADGGPVRQGTAHIDQFDVDPATGAVTAKAATSVPWPTAPGASGPTAATRMAVTPDGRGLYATSGESATGVAHFTIATGGALAGGSIVGVAGDPGGSSAVAIAPGGAFAWVPTSTGTPGRIDQFSVGAAGALAPLSPASVPYAVDASARDAVASPDGRSLYVGQDGGVGVWTIAAGGTLTHGADLASTIGGVTSAGVALAPSQAPVAAFTATPRPAGQATTFDASASSDPDGSIARYDWSFGDGTALADGGPKPSHVYAAGTWTATLTVTDADGTSTSQLWTGTRMLRDGGPSAQAARTVSVAAGPGGTGGATPAPDKSTSVTIVATSGTVRVKLPGSKVYVDVATLREIPLGSRIDARHGHVLITDEVNVSKHKTQSSSFYGGIFVVTQTKDAVKPILVATLAGGSFAGCTPRVSSSGRATARAATTGSPLGAAAGAAATSKRPARKRSKRKVRSLWGHGKGDFRTAGRRSSATVRGTWWLVEDRCDGTLTEVKDGFVDVHDTRLRKTIRLRAGKRSAYLAKAP